MEMEISEFEFRVRCYGKAELAGMYFPGEENRRAVKKLTRWVKRCEPLQQELNRDGYMYIPNMKTYTAREVRLIVRYLGEP